MVLREEGALAERTKPCDDEVDSVALLDGIRIGQEHPIV